MQAVLDGARPMVNLLWQREVDGRVFDSPERKATLDKSLRAHLVRIADPSIRSHYGEDIKRMRWELFGQKPRSPRAPFVPGKGRVMPDQPATPPTKGSLLATATAQVQETLREAVILATLITHPSLIHRFETALERLQFLHQDHQILRDLLLRHADDADIFAQMRTAAPAALADLMGRPHVAIAPPVRNKTDVELAAMCLAEELAKLDAHRGARREIAEAVAEIDGLVDEGLTWRLSQATLARNRADSPNRGSAADLGEDRASLSNHLQNLIDNRAWEKKSR